MSLSGLYVGADWVLSNLGESCNGACTRYYKTCDPIKQANINNDIKLGQVAGLLGVTCTNGFFSGGFAGNPVFYPAGSVYSSGFDNSLKCFYYTGGSGNCAAIETEVQSYRFCPCV